MAGVGPITQVFSLVTRFYIRCEQASEDYGNLREDIAAFQRALDDSKTALIQRGRIDIYNGCAKIIRDIQDLLASHASLATTNRNLREIVSWRSAATRLPALTSRLHSHIVLLNL